MAWGRARYLTQVLLRYCLCSLYAAVAIDASAQEVNTIAVGVISPKDGSHLVLAGESHEASIRLALEKLGPLQLGDLQVKLDLVSLNDRGIPEMAVTGALQLAIEHQVVAILGPVNSGSTQAVLQQLRAENIELPVISSLSTASELTRSSRRDKNFFRLIFDDTGRMSQYATFIKRENARRGEQHYLFLYEDDPYGIGLKDSLKDRFYTPNIITMSWCEVREDGCTESGKGATHYDALRSGQTFSSDFVDLLSRSNIDNIVLLGNINGALALVDGLKAKDVKTDYFFVGSNKRLFDEAPAGSITIGDPVLDYARAPTAELSKDWDKLLADFEEQAKKDRANFVMTAYEAAQVLHSALHTLLRGEQTLPEIGALRQSLLQVLEEETFDSLEPWRTISFSQGKLDHPPTAPIYRITRGLAREDEQNERRWVNVFVKRRNPLLEGPVEVRLDAHRAETGELGVYRIDETINAEYLLEQRTVKFSAGKAVERFHLFRPGLYRFRMTDIPFHPALAETRIGLSHNYFISAICALVGALLAVSRASSSSPTRIIRVLTGVATGLLLTFGSLYGRQLASWIPFPSFGGEPVVNAMLTGLLGGLVGPYMLSDLLLAWANLLFANRKAAREAGGGTGN